MPRSRSRSPDPYSRGELPSCSRTAHTPCVVWFYVCTVCVCMCAGEREIEVCVCGKGLHLQDSNVPHDCNHDRITGPLPTPSIRTHAHHTSTRTHSFTPHPPTPTHADHNQQAHFEDTCPLSHSPSPSPFLFLPLPLPLSLSLSTHGHTHQSSSTLSASHSPWTNCGFGVCHGVLALQVTVVGQIVDGEFSKRFILRFYTIAC
jgi:hypothetical protein